MDTFVVRVYRSSQDALPDDPRLRGVVEEVATGAHATFHDAMELLSILRRPQHDEPEVPPGARWHLEPPNNQVVPTEGGG